MYLECGVFTTLDVTLTTKNQVIVYSPSFPWFLCGQTNSNGQWTCNEKDNKKALPPRFKQETWHNFYVINMKTATKVKSPRFNHPLLTTTST